MQALVDCIQIGLEREYVDMENLLTHQFTMSFMSMVIGWLTGTETILSLKLMGHVFITAHQESSFSLFLDSLAGIWVALGMGYYFHLHVGT